MTTLLTDTYDLTLVHLYDDYRKCREYKHWGLDHFLAMYPDATNLDLMILERRYAEEIAEEIAARCAL
jgi:Uri superfamily endonuclease